MPWFKVSDDWATHPKTIAAGKDGRLLWVVTGTLMAKASTDGVIAKEQHQLYSALAGVPWKRNAAKLVEVGLWHTQEELRRCRDCRTDLDALNDHRRQEDVALIVMGPDDLYWHAWAAHQLPKHRQLSPEARAADDRARALRKDTALCQEIQKRDASLCRFCGHRVNWRDRRGARRATYDHLNPYCYTPNGGNFLEAIVTACGDCNSKKGKRTVAEWVAAGGHTLKPIGWQAGDPPPDTPPWASTSPPSGPPGSNPGSNPDLIPTRPEPDSGPDPTRAHGRAHPRLGPGQVGSGPGLGPGGAVTAGLGLGRAGPGLAGLVRAGSGAPPGASSAVSGETSSALEESDG
jgi:hypothetical protein